MKKKKKEEEEKLVWTYTIPAARGRCN